ncbi:MAG: Putative type IIS restriction /modification enzyme, N-terminal half [uncultured Sulfurovum sp.]|uniref:site-specific DNA-methyltransferase (adenine-specific) n=1 Tax=uncultured Sulfurovum sp. TaxID=269237 RepID=A0A6S6S6A8_9BACT|nr:MAG: Putative type IIS restriction /modification enzyme, N-terminal half [uncultured Sulfurovum sp.]
MIETLIDNDFNETKYLEFLRDRFNLETKKATIKKVQNSKYIESYQELGAIEIDGIDEIGFFIVKSLKSNIENIRVGFNQFIGNLIETNKYPYDGLIVAIYHPKSDVWRLSYVALELDENRELSTQPKRYTFELGKHIPTKTAKHQLEILNKDSTLEEIKEAFSVEKLSNEFFREYKSLYHALVGNILVVLKKNRSEIQIASKETMKDEKRVRAYIKKMLGRIVFLYFVQKKRWLNDDKKFLSNLFKEHASQEINFFDAILEPLFVEMLNKKRDKDKAVLGGKEYIVPYLNGGLFEKDDEDKLDFGVPNSDLEKVFELFDSYNFTVIEDTPHDSEIAIDPEMLGRVFEDLLEDRKDKGAFYTPREIVHYMCKESLNNYMETKPKEQDALAYLKKIKIIDPAIGSGAFPMGMLHEIIEKRYSLGDETELSDMKREVIQNSIYGVDIEPSAVEIAKLRFWLSIVVDEVKPTPLPNLAYKIMVGNSLIEALGSIDPLAQRKKGSKVEAERVDCLKELDRLITDYYKEHTDKNQLRAKITKEFEKLFKDISKKYPLNKDSLLTGTTPKDIEAREIAKTILDLKQNHFSDKIFLYKLFFRDIMNNGGFDVVIGNPPYIRHEKIKELKPKLKEEGYKSYSGTADLYIYFFEKGYRLLKENGTLSYITSNTYVNARYAEKFREFIINNVNVLSYIDFSKVQLFDSATVATSIFILNKNSQKNKYFQYCDTKGYKKDEDLEKFVSKNNFDYLQNDLRKEGFIFASKEELEIKKVIDKKGKKLNGEDWDIQIKSGIKTGFNEAFIIDEAKKNELIEKDPKSTEIIKPILRGRDIKKYDYSFANKWLINSHNNPPIDIEEYPVIKEHLDKYYDKLQKRSDKGISPYNLRNCAYLDDFEKDKIMWLELSDNSKFTLDTKKYYLEMTVFFMTGEDLKYLLALLNSKLIYWYFNLICAESGVGTNRWKKIYVEQLPIIKIQKEAQKPFEILVDYIIFLKASDKNIDKYADNETIIKYHFEEVIDSLVYELYFRDEFQDKNIEFLKYAKKYFKPIENLLEDEKIKVIHNSYLLLIEQHNEIRNNLELMTIRLKDLILPIKRSL